MTEQLKNFSDKAIELKNSYYLPTPAKMRKIGDLIQDVAIVAGIVVASIASPPAWIPVAILVTGRVGKIITNFWKE